MDGFKLTLQNCGETLSAESRSWNRSIQVCFSFFIRLCVHGRY